MPKWEDEIKGNTPVGSSAKCGRFRLDVHRHIHYPADVWLASCGYLFSQKVLKSKSFELAKYEAAIELKLILTEALADIKPESDI
jgi:hypothetical protein